MTDEKKSGCLYGRSRMVVWNLGSNNFYPTIEEKSVIPRGEKVWSP